ncbi:MAG: amidohydrolase [Gemmatimonadales bacterium]|nr:amidohydrolase [Gemmatimonadales bacterium]
MHRRQFLAAGAALALPRRLSVPRFDRADLILHGGVVHTLDPANRLTSAIAIAGGNVLAVGTDREIRALADPRTEAIDLRGRTVIPGINDSHLHAGWWGLTRPPFSVDVGYPAVKSIADVARVVGEAAASRRPGEWIQGRGWDQPYFAEGRAPTREDLDRTTPDHPVMLTEFSGHATWVNSRALALAGITRETVPPQGGIIVKDERGEPTGVLFEGAAGLVRRVVPPPSAADRDQALGIAIGWMLEHGITSYTDPGVDPGALAILADRARAGRLGIRATVLLGAGRSVAGVRETLERRQELAGVDPRWLRVTGVKFYADGIPTNNKTAWLHEPYVDGGTGAMVIAGGDDAERVRELHEMIRLAHQAGLQIGTHATGDRAIDAVVDGYLAAMAAHPRPDPRHYLIHADLVPRATLARMAQHGIGANFNAAIKYLIADGQRASIGPERAAYEWPYRTALEAGVRVATGSDAPVTDGDWRQGLATCLLRKGKQSGTVSGPEQRIGLADALRTFTAAGAWQDHADGWKGTLEPGRAADLVVLDGPLAKLPPEEFVQLKVTHTVVNGRVGYRA